jgi:hypothetical protein
MVEYFPVAEDLPRYDGKIFRNQKMLRDNAGLSGG